MRLLAFLIVTFFVAAATHETAGQRITIEDCYRLARANYPLVEQLDLIGKSEKFNLANAAKGWLPQITISAKASYQSDITRLPFDPAALGFSGIAVPTLSRDQYGAQVEVGQTVWDGGAFEAAIESLRAAAEVERTVTETNLYAINERVNSLFFGILVTGEQLTRLEVLENDLAATLAQVEALVENGLAEEADADAIRIEQLRAAGQRNSLKTTRNAYIEILARLTGATLDEATEFVKPKAMYPPIHIAINRPELAMFDAQESAIEARQKRLDAAINPKLGLFATGGYGKPGLNMLSDRFEAYYVVGARLSWNLGAIYTRKNDRRQIATDKKAVEVRRKTFLMNTDLDVSLKNGEIDRLREQLSYDDQMVSLHESVLRSSRAKMAAGTISGSDLTRDINALEAARQDKIVHEIELLMALHSLKHTLNN